MNYWFSSDWHFDHSLMLKLFRKEFKDTDEMNFHISEKYKKTVKPGDHFYFLGDLGYTKDSIVKFFELYYSSKIHFFWILGNHDLMFNSLIKRIETEYNNVHIFKGIYDIKIENQPITLCHYPMLTWNKSHYGAWQLYGHHHGDYSGSNDNYVPRVGKQLNVCYDLNNNFLEWKDIKLKMESRKQNWDVVNKCNIVSV